jgi:hypothetical protein
MPSGERQTDESHLNVDWTGLSAYLGGYHPFEAHH